MKNSMLYQQYSRQSMRQSHVSLAPSRPKKYKLNPIFYSLSQSLLSTSYFLSSDVRSLGRRYIVTLINTYNISHVPSVSLCSFIISINEGCDIRGVQLLVLPLTLPGCPPVLNQFTLQNVPLLHLRVNSKFFQRWLRLSQRGEHPHSRFEEKFQLRRVR